MFLRLAQHFQQLGAVVVLFDNVTRHPVFDDPPDLTGAKVPEFGRADPALADQNPVQVAD